MSCCLAIRYNLLIPGSLRLRRFFLNGSRVPYTDTLAKETLSLSCPTSFESPCLHHTVDVSRLGVRRRLFLDVETTT